MLGLIVRTMMALTEARDAQQMLGPLPDGGRQRQVYKRLHPQFIHQAQPEVVLRLDGVRGQRVWKTGKDGLNTRIPTKPLYSFKP